MGVRLHGDGGSEPDGSLPRGPGVASRGMVTGAVQVPPDGDPVVLLCDHATVGGYPVVATVVQADLGVLGQLRPGQSVGFELVDQGEAERARLEAQRALDRAVVGWFPVRTD
jgi:allophanate hydrolase subunit 2